MFLLLFLFTVLKSFFFFHEAEMFFSTAHGPSSFLLGGIWYGKYL